MQSDFIESLITDPPAGISFMNKKWDDNKGGRDQWVAWMTEIMSECLRVLKPGAHGLVWALPRTSHWTTTACENAGFEVRDVITHLFGSGFPKSLNISKAIDKQKLDSKQWDGWGTALKPASEHWILIRKPLSEKTVASNVIKFGTGGINIDGCRVEYQSENDKHSSRPTHADEPGNRYSLIGQTTKGHKLDHNPHQGRFPANLVLSHSEHCTDEMCELDCAVKALDGQTKDTRAGKPSGSFSCRPKRENTPNSQKSISDRGDLEKKQGYESGEVSGASRFFYCAKISTSERGEGNNHPTVKPKKLMAHMIKLITPPNGTVLDPFMGSGSTGIAASENGFNFIGIEKEREYYDIAVKRIDG